MPPTRPARKRHGEHYTPPALAAFLAGRGVLALADDRGGPVRVLDPACGDGELLLAAHRALTRSGHATVELTGFDLDDAAVDQARRRCAAAGIPATLHTGDFLNLVDELAPGGFDLVITNPPYVRTQVLGASTAAALARRFGLSGRVDLTHPFVSVLPRVLADRGVLALLCSNRFLTTRSGRNVRDVLTRRMRISELYDLGDTKLFDAAVLPAIVIASTGGDPPQATQPAGGVRFVRAYEGHDGPAASSDLYAALAGSASTQVRLDGRTIMVTVGRLDTGDRTTEPWRCEHDANGSWHRATTRNRWQTFGEVAKIRVGIKTTADAVFIRDDWSQLPARCRPEAELLLPLLTHRNVAAWHPPDPSPLRVLYPYDLCSARRRVLDLADYPGTRGYLRLHEQRLRSRRYVVDGGREWFEIWVPQRPARWADPKIVFPDISERPRFSIDRSGAVVNGDCYWISVPDLPTEEIAYLMLGVANSSFGLRFYDAVCGNRLYAGRRRWMTQYVNLFPLPHPTAAVSQKIIQIARTLCGATVLGPDAPLAELDDLVERAFSAVPDPLG